MHRIGFKRSAPRTTTISTSAASTFTALIYLSMRRQCSTKSTSSSATSTTDSSTLPSPSPPILTPQKLVKTPATTIKGKPVGTTQPSTRDDSPSKSSSIDEFPSGGAIVEDSDAAAVTSPSPSPADEMVTASKASKETLLNPLLGRKIQNTPKHLAPYLAIGFGVDEQNKRLFLEDPAKFDAWAESIREGTASFPEKWPRTLQQTLTRIIGKNNKVSTIQASEMCEGFIERAIERIAVRERVKSMSSMAGAIGGNVDDILSSDVTLNVDQSKVIELAKQGLNLYVAGDAGTGKTITVQAIRKALTNLRLVVASTATTGLAACHIGGCTFHHAFKLNKTSKSFGSREMAKLDVVIIDEISMLTGPLFDAFDEEMQRERNCSLPFGGAQVILCGDFLQLGCIYDKGDLKVRKYPIFQSKAFQSFLSVRLTEQVRQSAFPRYVDQLRELRTGSRPEDLEDTIKLADEPLPESAEHHEVIRLVSRNAEARAANSRRLAELPGEALTLPTVTDQPRLAGAWTPSVQLQVPADFDADSFRETVRAKLGIDVPPNSLLLYKLFDDGYVLRLMLPHANEELAKAHQEQFTKMVPQIPSFAPQVKVVDTSSGHTLFTQSHEDTLYKLTHDHPVVSEPLELKVGAQVLLRSNLSPQFPNGLVGTVKRFVPCERDNLSKDFIATQGDHTEAYAKQATLTQGMPVPLMPVVEFRNGAERAIPPVNFSVGGDITTEFYELTTMAFPLTLAYSFTIHKVQGLTLMSNIEIDLRNAFVCDALLYVGMSRVKSPEQIRIVGLEDKYISADSDAVEFDKGLIRAQDALVPQSLPRAMWHTKKLSPLNPSGAKRPVDVRTSALKSAKQRGKLVAALPRGLPKSVEKFVKTPKTIKAKEEDAKSDASEEDSKAMPLFLKKGPSSSTGATN